MYLTVSSFVYISHLVTSPPPPLVRDSVCSASSYETAVSQFDESSDSLLEYLECEIQDYDRKSMPQSVPTIQVDDCTKPDVDSEIDQKSDATEIQAPEVSDTKENPKNLDESMSSNLDHQKQSSMNPEKNTPSAFTKFSELKAAQNGKKPTTGVNLEDLPTKLSEMKVAENGKKPTRGVNLEDLPVVPESEEPDTADISDTNGSADDLTTSDMTEVVLNDSSETPSGSDTSSETTTIDAVMVRVSDCKPGFQDSDDSLDSSSGE